MSVEVVLCALRALPRSAAFIIVPVLESDASFTGNRGIRAYPRSIYVEDALVGCVRLAGGLPCGRFLVRELRPRRQSRVVRGETPPRNSIVVTPRSGKSPGSVTCVRSWLEARLRTQAHREPNSAASRCAAIPYDGSVTRYPPVRRELMNARCGSRDSKLPELDDGVRLRCPNPELPSPSRNRRPGGPARSREELDPFWKDRGWRRRE